MRKVIYRIVAVILATTFLIPGCSNNQTNTSSTTQTATQVEWITTPVPLNELTEGNATKWTAWSSDRKATTVQDDFNLKKVGSASIKLQTESGFDVVLSYQLNLGKYWDLNGQQYLHFWLYTQNSNLGFQNNSPWVKLISSDDSYVQYQSNTDILDGSRGTWQEYVIPLSGDNIWKSTNIGSASLNKIIALEIHSDTWDYGFTLWIDGLAFENSESDSSTNISSVSSTIVTATKIKALSALDDWLIAHPNVADCIIWEDATGPHDWYSWSVDERNELSKAFELACQGGSIPVPDIPNNLANLNDSDMIAQILSSNDAWNYFVASVAQSLSVEIQHSVQWSILDYSKDQLFQLLDSRAMFHWDATSAGYKFSFTDGMILPESPKAVLDFLKTNNFIAPTRLDTVANVVNWCHDNLVHFLGGYETSNVEDQWQYRGFPPMKRVINGTTMKSDPNWPVSHFTAGCWGTVGLLRVLLCAVNVPVKLVSPGNHAQPWFMADNLYLSHGDDPYSADTFADPPIPAKELLIDQKTYDSWFGPQVSRSDKNKNVGRQTTELSLIYLSYWLLWDYRQDIEASKSHGEGEVFNYLKNYYTLDQLEAMNLWTRMDAKIASSGGITNVLDPYSYIHK